MMYNFATIITKEGRWYVARAVELGVVSQGRNVKDAKENLREAVELFLEDNPRWKKMAPRHVPLITTLKLQPV